MAVKYPDEYAFYKCESKGCSVGNDSSAGYVPNKQKFYKILVDLEDSQLMNTTNTSY